jgi:hypothetical protein
MAAVLVVPTHTECKTHGPKWAGGLRNQGGRVYLLYTATQMRRGARREGAEAEPEPHLDLRVGPGSG